MCVYMYTKHEHICMRIYINIYDTYVYVYIYMHIELGKGAGTGLQ